MNSQPSIFRRKRGFTLVEILLVIGIIAILLAVAGPSVFKSIAGNKLNASGDILYNKLVAAQQNAVAANKAMEFRFYLYQEKDTGNNSSAYQIYQVDLDPNTGKETSSQVAAPTYLNSGIVIAPNINLSTLVNTDANILTGTDTLRGAVTGTSTPYFAFRFLPDGTTSLDTGRPNNWYLTLVKMESSAATGVGGNTLTSPSNFYTIQVDPFTGRMRSFRP